MRKRLAVVGVALLVFAATPGVAQGRGPKGYRVTNDRALVVTREVLEKQGYEVVTAENRGRDIVVWYRRYEMKNGRVGVRGPRQRMVIHREKDQVVFLGAPNPILVDIDLRLKF
jgi:hypothetical protein